MRGFETYYSRLSVFHQRGLKGIEFSEDRSKKRAPFSRSHKDNIIIKKNLSLIVVECLQIHVRTQEAMGLSTPLNNLIDVRYKYRGSGWSGG